VRKSNFLSVIFLSSALVIFGPRLQGQEVPPANSAFEVPSIELILHEEKKVGFDLSGIGLTFPLKCEKSGAIAFLGIDFHPSGKWAVYEIEAPGKYRSFRFESLGLRQIEPSSAFTIDDDGVAHMVVKAVTSEEATKSEKIPIHPFLVSFDRDGQAHSMNALASNEIVMGIGVFPSGELLVAVRDRDRTGTWKILAADGHSLRDTPPESPHSSKIDMLTANAEQVMGTIPEITPWQGNLLTLYVGKGQVTEWRGSGVTRTVDLKTPKDLSPMRMIPSAKGNWMVMLGRREESIPELGGASGTLPDSVGEFDPVSGELIRIYRTSNENPGMGFACFQDGVFTYLKQDPKDGSLLIGSASIEK
jgi:hypothetical protein